MRTLLTAVRTTLLACLLPTLVLPAATAAPAEDTLVLGGVRVDAGPTTTQVVTVDHTGPASPTGGSSGARGRPG